MRNQQTLNRICQALNVPVEIFYTDTEVSQKFNLNQRVSKLMGNYFTLEDKDLSDKDILKIIADRISQDVE